MSWFQWCRFGCCPPALTALMDEICRQDRLTQGENKLRSRDIEGIMLEEDTEVAWQGWLTLLGGQLAPVAISQCVYCNSAVIPAALG